MQKRIIKVLLAISIIVVIGAAVALYRRPYLMLPGQIAMYGKEWWDTGLYLVSPRCPWQWGWLCWRRLTPRKVHVFTNMISWSPNGRYAAFHCSDGVIRGDLLYRAGVRYKPAVEFDAQTMRVRDGICLVDRARLLFRFRWLIDESVTANRYYDTIAWTPDSQYIIFESQDQGRQRLDPREGTLEPWHEETLLCDEWCWRMPWGEEIIVPKAAIEGVPWPSHWSIDDTKVSGGCPSPDGGRYISFSFGGGESDPFWMYIYDTQEEQLLYLATKRFPVDIAWLPSRWRIGESKVAVVNER
jgi:hypothetical protein